MTTNNGIYRWSQDPTGHPKLHMKIRLEAIKIGSTEIRQLEWNLVSFLPILSVKSDLRKFDFDWQQDPILP